jgi:hypothetical protein
MRYDWTFHCFKDGNYWECAVTDENGDQQRNCSETAFETRGDAILDAKRNGLDANAEAHVVVFKRYTS